MIEVQNLVKRYAGTEAVRDVSFQVQAGEIVGLLGRNGAGKSTILRILSCFLPATSGTVRVAGFDVFSQSEEVRRRIGYMPENNPLHTDMRVREYLKFRARLKGLPPGRVRERVDRVIEQCSLKDVHKRIIGQLSKGYRQRVGLADALVHEPELVILDEPTIGLDPNQLRTVRALIKELAGRHTVLLSTHILPEVEVTCTRVMILHQGRMLAADTPENLQRNFFEAGPITAEIAAPEAELRELCSLLPGVAHSDIVPLDGLFFRCLITPQNGADLREDIYRAAVENGWPLRELTRTRHTLEDIFVRVTRADGTEAPQP